MEIVFIRILILYFLCDGTKWWVPTKSHRAAGITWEVHTEAASEEKEGEKRKGRENSAFYQAIAHVQEDMQQRQQCVTSGKLVMMCLVVTGSSEAGCEDVTESLSAVPGSS